MATSHALILVLLILLAGLFLFTASMYIAKLTMKKDISARALLNNFGQKMWMTCGLGILFFSLYLIVVSTLSSVNGSSLRLNFFHLVYKHPIAFIYLGLLTFAFFSVSIYLARMIIIYWCNKNGR